MRKPIMTNDDAKREPSVPSFNPNYANARGKAAASANEEEAKDTNPGVSPASLPDHIEEKVLEDREPGSKVQIHDDNYAQYMNRDSGRYEEFLPEQNKGSFGPDRDHGGKTRRIHRQKSAVPPKRAAKDGSSDPKQPRKETA